MFFKGQLLNLLLLTALVIIALALVVSPSPEGSFLGISTTAWFVASLTIPIVHQLFVWLVWRSELCFSAITRMLGRIGFTVYGVVFMLLLFLRPLAVLGLAVSDRGSIHLPVAATTLLPALLAIPAIYTLYSVARYFGFARAMGIDHFDPAYRNAPLVRDGIFRFTGNAMYTFGFFIFWVIALAFSSRAALVAAFFNHSAVWVHYFCTERPDMDLIYRGTRASS